MKNIFDLSLLKDKSFEHFETLLENRQITIERISSFGHSTAINEWYDQDHDEWCLLLQGQATIEYDNTSLDNKNSKLLPSDLSAGDYLFLPKHCRHRVAKVSSNAIWLAIHIKTSTD